jgi:hypothetical protein
MQRETAVTFFFRGEKVRDHVTKFRDHVILLFGDGRPRPT